MQPLRAQPVKPERSLLSSPDLMPATRKIVPIVLRIRFGGGFYFLFIQTLLDGRSRSGRSRVRRLRAKNLYVFLVYFDSRVSE